MQLQIYIFAKDKQAWSIRMLYALYKLYGDVDIPTATFELR